MFFLLFGKWNSLAPGGTLQARKIKKKKPTPKKFLIFREIELSSSKLNKLLYFRKLKFRAPSLKKQNIFKIFPKTVLPTFRDDY